MPLTDNHWTIIFAVTVLVVIFSIIGFAIYQDHLHTVFLREHGCQIVYEHETGRTVHSGKTSHAEVITLYECADGNRTEVR